MFKIVSRRKIEDVRVVTGDICPPPTIIITELVFKKALYLQDWH
jgi:hypothetical protein